MNYQKIYDSIVSRAMMRTTTTEYYEKHHIIPEHFYIDRKRKGPPGWLEGDPNDTGNLVLLTPEEHYIAHQLLVKIYPSHGKLIFAVKMMTVNNKYQDRSNNKMFGWLKRLNAQEMRKLHSGKKVSQETIEKQKATKKAHGPYIISPETNEKRRLAGKNRKIKEKSKTDLNGYILRYGEIDGPTKYKEDSRKKSNSGARNGMFGKTHTDEVCNILADVASNRFSGKSYEELYGKEKADELKKIRSIASKEYIKNNPTSGKDNANYNSTIHTVQNLDTREIFVGTRYEIGIFTGISGSGLTELTKYKKIKNRWQLI